MPPNNIAHKDDIISRGDKSFSRLGTLTFVGFRLLSPVVQYCILSYNWAVPLIKILHGTPLMQVTPLHGQSFFDHVGLSPYRFIIFAMSIGSAMKHIYWATAITQEKISPLAGLGMGLPHTIGDTINTLLCICAQTSANANGENFPQSVVVIGTSVYVLGVLIELISEQQRYFWKKDPSHKGQIYQGGLFSLSRHINYFGYILWRTGYGLAASGWSWTVISLLAATYGFAHTKLPQLQHYMRNRVSAQQARI